MISEQILRWGAICGGLTGIGIFIRMAYRGARKVVGAIALTVYRVEKMNELIDYELTPNGGGSIKDRIGSTQTSVDDLNHRFDLHLAANARDQASMWSAIEAIAKSSPPEEEQ